MTDREAEAAMGTLSSHPLSSACNQRETDAHRDDFKLLLTSTIGAGRDGLGSVCRFDENSSGYYHRIHGSILISDSL